MADRSASKRAGKLRLWGDTELPSLHKAAGRVTTTLHGEGGPRPRRSTSTGAVMWDIS